MSIKIIVEDRGEKKNKGYPVCGLSFNKSNLELVPYIRLHYTPISTTVQCKSRNAMITDVFKAYGYV